MSVRFDQEERLDATLYHGVCSRGIATPPNTLLYLATRYYILASISLVTSWIAQMDLAGRLPRTLCPYSEG